MTTTVDIGRLRRLRFGIWTIFALGVLVSLAANVLHADPNPISQAVAGWAPVALLLAVELLSRVPVRTGWRTWCRITATGIVAAIAAWVSYWHMVGVAIRYGETGLTPYLLPVSVDGLIVIASISLVEIGARIREHTTTPASTHPAPPPAPAPATAPTPAPAPATVPPPNRTTTAAPMLTTAAAQLAAQRRSTPRKPQQVNGHTFEQEALL